MADIGIRFEEPTPLVLTKGRDFEWTFENLDASGDPVDFDAGSLYIEFPKILDEGVPRKWEFTIDEETPSQAYIKVESAAVDLIPPRRAQYQLVFLPEGEAAGGRPITLGTVEVQGI